jgi:hypothetical protein
MNLFNTVYNLFAFKTNFRIEVQRLRIYSHICTKGSVVQWHCITPHENWKKTVSLNAARVFVIKGKHISSNAVVFFSC